KMPSFDQWWDQNVKPHFETVMDELYKNYVDEVVNKLMSNAVTKDLGKVPAGEDTSIVVYDGYLAALKSQILNQFNGVLSEKAQSMPMDLYYSSHQQDEAAGREQLLSEYRSLKGQYLDLFGYLVGETQQLRDQALIDELEAHKEGLYYQSAQRPDRVGN